MAKKRKKKDLDKKIESPTTEDVKEKSPDKGEIIMEDDSLDEVIEKDKNKNKNKKKSNLFVNFIIILTLISSCGYFIINIIDNNTSINTLINSSILVLFSIIYLIVCLTTRKKNKFSILISSLLLLLFFMYNINNSLNIIKTPTNTVTDFRGKSLTEVVKWASANNIKVNQDFEYSDMIPEYKVISQDIPINSSINNIDEITVSVSEGPNPSKEIIVPSMVTWDDERVIKYIKNNHLSKVDVEFIESDKLKDTVIEQDKSGNMKRDDDLKLTFSYGDEGNSDDVKLIDFTNKSKFEIEFYMKQHHLKYKFEYDFSSKIKKGSGLSQDIKPGEVVKVDDKEIVITLSKGPKIKVPNLKNMSISKLTEWSVKNRIKLEFIDKYDDSIREGNVISSDKEKGDIIEQGSTIKITLSRGKLKMPGFKSIDEFYEWADKYEIKYEVRREFSDSVKSGEVISYSVKKGKAIKNGEIIIVKVSDGENCKVPDLKGLTKSEAISKLKKAKLEYNFVYRGSDKTKDKVIDQSFSSGSEISCGTTITVTLSNGKKEDSEVNKRDTSNNNSSSSNKNNSSNSNKNNNSNNTSNNNNTNNNPAPVVPEKTCNECNIRSSQIYSVIEQYNSCGSAASALRSLIQSKCSGITVNVSCQNRDGYDSADFVSGYDGGPISSCSSVSIVLAN